MAAARPQSFHVRAEFRAPLDFVFRWCTDYRSDDARREKDHYTRRILSRSRNRVVYEDLSSHGDGWRWSRHTVDLHPPLRWHSDSVGSHRTLDLDYTLTALGPERTRLDLRWRRWATPIGAPRIPKRETERETTVAWVHFGKELEKDYRKSRRARRR